MGSVAFAMEKGPYMDCFLTDDTFNVSFEIKKFINLQNDAKYSHH